MYSRGHIMIWKADMAKLTRFHPQRREVIKEEVDRLLVIIFIQEVQYLEWLAKGVVVPKKNGK